MATLNNNGAPFMDFLGARQNLAIARQARDVSGVRDAAIAGAGLLNSHVSILPGRVSLPNRAALESPAMRLIAVTPGYWKRWASAWCAVARSTMETSPEHLVSR